MDDAFHLSLIFEEQHHRQGGRYHLKRDPNPDVFDVHAGRLDDIMAGPAKVIVPSQPFVASWALDMPVKSHLIPI
jgi:hypothetical protein